MWFLVVDPEFSCSHSGILDQEKGGEEAQENVGQETTVAVSKTAAMRAPVLNMHEYVTPE